MEENHNSKVFLLFGFCGCVGDLPGGKVESEVINMIAIAEEPVIYAQRTIPVMLRLFV